MENMNQNQPVVATNNTNNMSDKRVVGLAALTTVGVMVLAKASRWAYASVAGAVASAKAESATK